MPDSVLHLSEFEAAQRGAWGLLRALVPQLEAGMSERDLQALAVQQGRAAGFTRWFRPPLVRFGAPPVVRFTDRPRSGTRLEPGMIVELELAPATDRAFGDAGLAFAFGQAEEPAIVTDARALCEGVCGFASRWKCTGELFVFAEAWANNRRASLGGQHSVGFVVLGPERAWGGRWPEGAWAQSLLRRHQVQYFNPRRMNGLYVIRPRLVAQGQGAAFAEMILVTPDDKRILGRDEGEAIGGL